MFLFNLHYFNRFLCEYLSDKDIVNLAIVLHGSKNIKLSGKINNKPILIMKNIEIKILKHLNIVFYKRLNIYNCQDVKNDSIKDVTHIYFINTYNYYKNDNFVKNIFSKLKTANILCLVLCYRIYKIDCKELPKSLKILSVCCDTKIINLDALPNLKYLKITDTLKSPYSISDSHIESYLEYDGLKCIYSYSIFKQNLIPKKIEYLCIYDCKINLRTDKLPEKLKYLSFGCKVNKFDFDLVQNSIEYLEFCNGFNYALYYNPISDNLKYLDMGTCFNRPLNCEISTYKLKTLILPFDYKYTFRSSTTEHKDIIKFRKSNGTLYNI